MCADPTGGILDFCSILRFFRALLPDFFSWEVSFVLAGITLAAIVLNSVIAATALNSWFERRALGRIQARLGPNRWGPFGLFQPIADVFKLLTKEDTVPGTADRAVFTLAPVVFLVPGLLVFAVIPFGEQSFLGRLNVGALFIIAVTGLNTFGIFMGGWSSRNKYAMFGAMRGVAMLISYEVPMALSIVAVAIAAGSLAMMDIVGSQAVPFLLVQPLGFLVFMTAASAEMSRAPFDMIEAESELGAGYHIEYSGIKWALFQQAEFMAPIVTAAVATVLFLGGTRGYAPVPGQVWFLLKAFAVVFALIWMRATWPRLRVDQIMGFAWKGLLPLSLINLFVVAAEVLIIQTLRDQPGALLAVDDMWIMAAVNWAVAVAAIVVFANLLGQRRFRRPEPVPSPLANMTAEAD